MAGFMPLSCLNEHFARLAMDRIRDLGRVVIAERLGVGESDPIDLDRPPTLDDVVEDLIAVMDHAEMESAALVGVYSGVPVMLRLAARHPDRVTRIALEGPLVCWESNDELEGVADFFRRTWAEEVEHGPSGDMDMLSIVAPSLVDNNEFRAWWAEIGRRGASPRSATAIGTADESWDVREDLASITAPTIVVQRPNNRFIPASHGRYIAAHIHDARLVEVPGIDFLGFVDPDDLFDPIEDFLAPRARRGNRALAAVLFTDIVDSTRRSTSEGDRRWTRIIAEHDEVVAEVVHANGGELIKSTGDGILAVFTGPAAAIDAAQAIRTRLQARSLELRAGIHAGEIERRVGDVSGIAVTIAARVMAFAGAGEVLVSNAVPPLVAGSGLEFDARYEVELKGVPGTWTLFSPR
ncbi:MAG TPA: adenylate/guanylate cyclase domain-containing protein [Acidimicrobiales bacterium]|nr:adenylate/guanylate cyclase domain-containing protein [Acidimicrobiales bacterium]